MRRFMRKKKFFEFETCKNSLYLVLNFYEINGDGKI